MFVGWLYSNDKEAKPYASQDYDSDVENLDLWKLYPVEAYVIGDKFMAKEFSTFALSKIIQYAHSLNVYDMETIYEEVQADDPLRLFARQWVRWRCSQRPDLWASSQSIGLKRDRHLRQGGCGTRPNPVLDPRRIALGHWYRNCGIVGHDCEHLPTERGATVFETDRKTEEKIMFDRLRAKTAMFNRKSRARVLVKAFLGAHGTSLTNFTLVVLGIGVVSTVIYRKRAILPFHTL